MEKRSAGILLHPTSLPGKFGIGDLGPSAVRFLDWAAAAGQTLWQVLPLGPTGFGNSPYGTRSAFAGNPLLISPERLVEAGLADESALSGVPEFREDHVDFGAVIPWKERLLRSSFEFFRTNGSGKAREAVRQFVDVSRNDGWLDDWTLFQAFKSRYHQAAWPDWDSAIAKREAAALASASSDMADEIAYHEYVQFVFFSQWGELRNEASRRGITIMGDVPIYVALDSADVWANSELFLLDDDRRPLALAGVPPDYFSPTGQLWGNPLYRWDRMKERGFDWWVARMRANFRLADVVRLDHFRGFAGFWQVPAGQETASGGSWVEGPGLEFFHALKAALGQLPIVAEDLGLITPDVEELRVAVGAPGMRVLQFGFGDLDNIHLPHHHSEDMVAYTGTHDNATTREWFEGLEDESKQLALDYLGSSGGEDIEWQMIRAAYRSVARTAIVPMQDALGGGADCRMNTPGQAADNWSWRLPSDALSDDIAARLRRLAEITGRVESGSSPQ